MSNVTSSRWIAPFVPPTIKPQFDVNPMQKLAFGFTAFFIFLLYSRLQDFVYFLHLPAITLSIAIVLMIITGNIRMITKVASTKWSLAMTFCMVCAIPFAVWRGGALETVIYVWLKSLVVYCVVTSAITIPRYCTRLITIAAFGILCGTVIGLLAGSVSEGRMGEINARFGDANEFAQVLLIGMCLMLGYAATPGRQQLSKIMAYMAAILMLVSFFRTGSRGGFIGLLVVVLFVFINNSITTKIAILVAALLVSASIMLFLPDTLKYRYGVMLGLMADTRTSMDAVAAAGSREGRTYLFMKSVEITARHPLFGVGTGLFAVAENSIAIQEGRPRGSWHETHNMYTQISSENGIPAFLFFMASLIAAFRSLNRVIGAGKNTSDMVVLEASRTAYWVRLALLGMATSGMFLSIAYTIELQVLIAFAMGLHYSLNSYMQFAQAQNPPIAAPPRAPSIVGGYQKPMRPAWTNARFSQS